MQRRQRPVAASPRTRRRRAAAPRRPDSAQARCGTAAEDAPVRAARAWPAPSRRAERTAAGCVAGRAVPATVSACARPAAVPPGVRLPGAAPDRAAGFATAVGVALGSPGGGLRAGLPRARRRRAPPRGLIASLAASVGPSSNDTVSPRCDTDSLASSLMSRARRPRRRTPGRGRRSRGTCPSSGGRGEQDDVAGPGQGGGAADRAVHRARRRVGHGVGRPVDPGRRWTREHQAIVARPDLHDGDIRRVSRERGDDRARRRRASPPPRQPRRRRRDQLVHRRALELAAGDPDHPRVGLQRATRRRRAGWWPWSRRSSAPPAALGDQHVAVPARRRRRGSPAARPRPARVDPDGQRGTAGGQRVGPTLCAPARALDRRVGSSELRRPPASARSAVDQHARRRPRAARRRAPPASRDPRAGRRGGQQAGRAPGRRRPRRATGPRSARALAAA